MTKENNPIRNNRGLIIFLALIITCLSVAVFSLSNKLRHSEELVRQKGETIKQHEDNLAQQRTQIDTRTEELSSLKESYVEMMAKNDSLGLSKGELELKVAELDRQIASLSMRSQLSESENANLKQLIAKFEKDLNAKNEQIARLIRNRDSLQAMSEQMASIQGELTEKMRELEKRVEKASVLEAKDLEILGVDAKGRETDRKVFRSRKLSKVKVNFQLAKNASAVKGNKTFFLRVIDDQNAVLIDANDGGVFLDANNKEALYSTKTRINFKNEKENVSFLFNKGGEYHEGIYRVEIFAEGYKIGSGSFEVK